MFTIKTETSESLILSITQIARFGRFVNVPWELAVAEIGNLDGMLKMLKPLARKAAAPPKRLRPLINRLVFLKAEQRVVGRMIRIIATQGGEVDIFVYLNEPLTELNIDLGNRELGLRHPRRKYDIGLPY